MRKTFEVPFGIGASAASRPSGSAIIADFPFALREVHDALFHGRDAAPNARAAQHTRSVHGILPTFEEVGHAQHGAMHSRF